MRFVKLHEPVVLSGLQSASPALQRVGRVDAHNAIFWVQIIIGFKDMYFPSSHVKTPSAILFNDLIIALMSLPLLYGKVMMPFILVKYTDGIGSSIIVPYASIYFNFLRVFFYDNNT